MVFALIVSQIFRKENIPIKTFTVKMPSGNKVPGAGWLLKQRKKEKWARLERAPFLFFSQYIKQKLRCVRSNPVPGMTYQKPSKKWYAVPGTGSLCTGCTSLRLCRVRDTLIKIMKEENGVLCIHSLADLCSRNDCCTSTCSLGNYIR